MLRPNQFGFRPNRSTACCYTRLVHDIRCNMDNGLLTGVIFMDFRKAFDTVPPYWKNYHQYQDYIQLVINDAESVLYADDTAVYYANKDPLQIQDVITKQCNNIFEWLNTNNLYLNQNKGKTEFVLFGTPQRLSRSSKIIN